MIRAPFYYDSGSGVFTNRHPTASTSVAIPNGSTPVTVAANGGTHDFGTGHNSVKFSDPSPGSSTETPWTDLGTVDDGQEITGLETLGEVIVLQDGDPTGDWVDGDSATHNMNQGGDFAYVTGGSVNAPGLGTISDLLANLSDSGQIRLTWTPAGSADAHQAQYRELGSGTWLDSPSGALGGDVGTDTVTGLTDGTEYEFRVVASRTGFSDTNSNVVTKIPQQALIFEDSFETGDTSHTQSGAFWASGGGAEVTDTNPRTGTYSLEYAYSRNKPGTLAANASAGAGLVTLTLTDPSDPIDPRDRLWFDEDGANEETHHPHRIFENTVASDILAGASSFTVNVGTAGLDLTQYTFEVDTKNDLETVYVLDADPANITDNADGTYTITIGDGQGNAATFDKAHAAGTPVGNQHGIYGVRPSGSDFVVTLADANDNPSTLANGLSSGAAFSCYHRSRPGVDDTEEKKLRGLPNLKSLFLEFYLWVGTNFHMRSNGNGLTNKFTRAWQGTSATANTMSVTISHDRASYTEAKLRGIAESTGPGLPESELNPMIGPSGPIALGQWHQIRQAFITSSAIGVEDGAWKLWVDGVLVSETGPYELWNEKGLAETHFNEFYLLGWANTGYDKEMKYWIDDVKVLSSDPGW